MKHLTLITILLSLGLTTSWAQGEESFFDQFHAEQVADNVYVIMGPIADPNPENLGFINNPGFVITESGVVCIDPGSSRAVGEMVLDRIKKVTPKPIIAVFNTHEHGDHWLANGVIQETFPDIPIYAHETTIEKIHNGGGKTWLQIMQQLTKSDLAKTQIVAPNVAVKHGDEIVLGDTTIKIHHYGTSHTHADIMIELINSKTLFLGDNVFINRLPRLDDGDVQGNIASLNKILDSDIQHFIPGHGPIGDRSIVETYRDYLTTLYQAVQHYYEEDLTDFEMKDQVKLKLQAYSDWYGFESELGKNISLVYLQVENADF